MKFFRGLEYVSSNNFGDDLDHDADQGFLKKLFHCSIRGISRILWYLSASILVKCFLSLGLVTNR